MAQEDAPLAAYDAAEEKTTDREGSADHVMISNIQDAELDHAETHRSRNRAQVEVLALNLEWAAAEK